MARNLSPQLTKAMINGNVRRPAHIIKIYDIRSDEANLAINDVVLGLTSPDIERDFTGEVIKIDVTESAGDYVGQGVAASYIKFPVEGAQFDPLGDDPLNVWLRAGNVVRVWEGDLAEPNQALWPNTFTGIIQGQPGFSENRPSARSTLNITAIGREARALKYTSESAEYPVNTSYFDMAEDIAQSDMGLDLNEIDWPTWGSTITSQLSTQFVDEEPLVSIARAMFPDGFMPRFTGEGKLGATSGEITKSPTRIYTDDSVIRSVVRPESVMEGTNSIIIKGLDSTLTDVVGPVSLLAEASATLGFFTQKTAISVRWSDDGTAQARDTFLKIIKDINGLINFGSQIYTEIGQPLEASDSIRGEIFVDTGFHPSLLTLIQVIKIADSFIPDAVVGFIGGSTIPVGRLVEAALDSSLDMITAGMGQGQWEVWGKPIEWVYAEIKSTAKVKNLRSEDTVPIEIENHLINSEAECETVAIRVLKRERAKLNSRQISGIHDLTLEPDDIFEMANGRRFMIDTIGRTLERGGSGGLANYGCFEVTPGIRV